MTRPATPPKAGCSSHPGVTPGRCAFNKEGIFSSFLLIMLRDEKGYMSYLFSSESVCAGHPDKICDQVSDAIVDAALKLDHNARIAVETLVTTNQIVLAGEVTSNQTIEYEHIARNTIQALGYTDQNLGFTFQDKLTSKIHQQSPDIAVGVDDGGAGDQGLMFGYACKQTPELMPLPIMIAHDLSQRMDYLGSKYDWIRPDGKAQVTIEYNHKQPVSIDTIVLARPYDPEIHPEELKQMLYIEAVQPVIEKYKYNVDKKGIIVNGTGKWEIGGPASDTGVTGRKIIVDTYGGWARHGGGCFSGKDATKVDRSAAYAARWVAKNIVAQNLADECEIQVAYVIGQAEPVSIMIETFGSAKKSDKLIKDFANQLTTFKVKEIIEKLDLRKPVFQSTATYGHFGRPEFTWEHIAEI